LILHMHIQDKKHFKLNQPNNYNICHLQLP
jgi:hypothetical protein